MLAYRMDLISMKPEPDLASSTYCLANAGAEYLVYVSADSMQVSLILPEISGTYSVEWFNPNTGEFRESESVNGGNKLSLTSPFENSDALVHLKR